MSYNKTDWQARLGTDLNRFSTDQPSIPFIKLTNTPTSISQAGTPFNISNMNNLEKGIKDAADPIEITSAASTDLVVPTVGTNSKFTIKITETITGTSMTLARTGETAKPLLNTDGTDVEELSIDTKYFEVIEETVNFILRSSGGAELLGAAFEYVDETATTGNTSYAVVCDDTYVYVGCNDGYTRKYDIATMTLQATSPLSGATIRDAAIDDDYIYIVELTNNQVHKYDKTDMSLVGSTIAYDGTNGFCVAVDDTYIYFGGISTGLATIQRFNKATLAYVDESPIVGDSINDIKTNSTHVFAGENTSQTIKKYDISDLSYVSTTTAFGGNGVVCVLDDSYIYAAGNATSIKKYNISTMALVATSSAYNVNLYRIAIYNNLLYVTGNGSSPYRTLSKMSKDNLAILDTSSDLGGIPFAVTSCNDFVFVGGSFNKTFKFGRGLYTEIDGTIYDIL